MSDDPMMEIVEKPEADRPAEPKVWKGAGPRMLLERGWPGELVPDGTKVAGPYGMAYPSTARADMKRAARKYCLDPYNAGDARERVKAVWLDDEYHPPWQPFTPRPGKEPDFG